MSINSFSLQHTTEYQSLIVRYVNLLNGIATSECTLCFDHMHGHEKSMKLEGSKNCKFKQVE